VIPISRIGIRQSFKSVFVSWPLKVRTCQLSFKRLTSNAGLSFYSFLGADLEEVESRYLPHTETMLTSASEDIHEKKDETNQLLRKNFEGEDLSENEDTETNSEGKSESAVVNFLKSIESSTDTLVAESGVMSESTYNQKVVVHELQNKTEYLLAERSSNLDRTRSPIGVEKTESDDSLVGELTEATKDPENVSRLADAEEGTCLVCETSRKLLLGDAVSSTPSSAGTSNIPSNTNGVQSVPVSSSTGTNGSSSGYGSKFSSYNTPMHSRTPSTGIPATPVEEVPNKISYQSQEKWNPESALPLLGSIITSTSKSSYDVDGLVPLHDEVQSRLHIIVSNYRVSFCLDPM
jgi:hypothetical protein